MEAIRKCEGTGCSLKTDCYRYMAEDAGPRQLWLAEVPFKHQSCSAFAPLRVQSYFDSRRRHADEDR